MTFGFVGSRRLARAKYFGPEMCLGKRGYKILTDNQIRRLSTFRTFARVFLQVLLALSAALMRATLSSSSCGMGMNCRSDRYP